MTLRLLGVCLILALGQGAARAQTQQTRVAVVVGNNLGHDPGRTLRYAEAEAAAWRSVAKLPVVTARPFAFIGPYQGLDKPWAVNNFLRDALLCVPIRILGDADTVRSYMYPSDMAFWLLAILAEDPAAPTLSP